MLYLAHRRLVLAGLDGRAAWSVMLARGARVGGNVIRAVRGRVRTATL